MAKKVKLRAADGHELEAFRADPNGTPRGGLVALQEIFGLTPHMDRLCDAFAEAGYAVCAPALFDRVGRDLVHPYTRDGVEAGRTCFAALGEVRTPGIADLFVAVMANQAGQAQGGAR